MNLLIRFTHGLGDAVQATVILKHIRHHRPDWTVDCWSLRGKHSAFHGLCRRSYHDQEAAPAGPYDRELSLGWFENYNYYGDRPCSKITNCLHEILHLEYLPELGRYEVRVSDEARERARRWLESIGCSQEGGKFRAGVLHYQGNTSTPKKNLTHEAAASICTTFERLGLVPVILDWDKRSPLPDGKRIFTPGCGPGDVWGGFGSGDAETICALVSQCAFYVGIDSGPGKCASATDTPTVICWTKHHPIQFHDPAPNTVHLVPINHASLPPAHQPEILEYFKQHYHHSLYRPGAIAQAVAQEVYRVLSPDEKIPAEFDGGALRATGYGVEYYEEHSAAGLDYLEFGDWQRQYAAWLTEALGWKGKRLLDVGCACGSIVRGFGEAGTYVSGIDVNEHMIRLAKEKWPDMQPILWVCDAVNMHLFKDGSYDAIHTAQVAEHWRPDYVPLILAEFRRVLTPGGLVFCCMDTEELFARQGRDLSKEDPTHICIKPLRWWDEAFAAAGFEIVTDNHRPQLQGHQNSFLRRYDWDWLVARRR